MNFFHTAIDTPVIISLTIIWLITSSIETFDMRLNQAEKTPSITMREAVRRSEVKNHTPISKAITNIIAISNWILILIIFLLNPLYAVAIFIIRFILKVLPVLETIGGWVMKPIMKK